MIGKINVSNWWLVIFCMLIVFDLKFYEPL